MNNIWQNSLNLSLTWTLNSRVRLYWPHKSPLTCSQSLLRIYNLHTQQRKKFTAFTSSLEFGYGETVLPAIAVVHSCYLHFLACSAAHLMCIEDAAVSPSISSRLHAFHALCAIHALYLQTLISRSTETQKSIPLLLVSRPIGWSLDLQGTWFGRHQAIIPLRSKFEISITSDVTVRSTEALHREGKQHWLSETYS